MVNIVIWGSKADESDTSFVIKALKKLYGVAVITEYCCDFKQSNVNVVKNNFFKRIEGENVIIIFTENAEIKKDTFISKDAICVVNSENKEVLKTIASYGNKICTWGFSSVDTFSISSCTDEVCVSLVRSIKDIRGKILEPFDMPVISQYMPRGGAIMLVAALVLSDIAKDLKSLNV